MWFAWAIVIGIWVWIVVAFVIAVGIGATGAAESWRDRNWRK